MRAALALIAPRGVALRPLLLAIASLAPLAFIHCGGRVATGVAPSDAGPSSPLADVEVPGATDAETPELTDGAGESSPLDSSAHALGTDAGPDSGSSSSTPPAPCIDTQNDARNCGACGHDCLGGACNGGTCGAVQLYAPTQDSVGPFRLAVDATHLYWTDNEGDAIMQVPLAGGPATLLASSMRPTAIAIDSARAYWTTQLGTVESVPLGGGDVTVLANFEGESAGIAIDGSYAYWTQILDTSADGSVMRVPLSGGTSEILASAQYTPQAIAVDSSNVYWVDEYVGSFTSPALMMAPLAGGTGTYVDGAGSSDTVASVAADGTNAYWTADAYLSKIPRGGGAALTLASVPQDTFAAIAVDAAAIYATTGLGRVVRVPLSGGTPVTLASGYMNLETVVVDDKSIFFADTFQGLIYRLAK